MWMLEISWFYYTLTHIGAQSGQLLSSLDVFRKASFEEGLRGFTCPQSLPCLSSCAVCLRLQLPLFPGPVPGHPLPVLPPTLSPLKSHLSPPTSVYSPTATISSLSLVSPEGPHLPLFHMAFGNGVKQVNFMFCQNNLITYSRWVKGCVCVYVYVCP